MSSAPTPAAPPPPAKPTEIQIFSHSNLFYWWPVWLLALILGVLTMTSGEYMVIVPSTAEMSRKHQVQTAEGKLEPREGVLFPKADFNKENLKKHLPPNLDEDDLKQEPTAKKHLLHATSRKGYGVIFATVLLIVIFITNVPLRGMLSVVIIVVLVLGSVILALWGVWDRIMYAISLLDIRLTAGGYFFLAAGLFALWSLAFFFFDRQIYITFTKGRMDVCLEIGHGVDSYDTLGMAITKERSDLFRHWILGLGSGDLIVKVTGADRKELRLPNVLFINSKMKAIQELANMG